MPAAYTKHPGHWCAGSSSQLHHEAQQRHTDVSLRACEELCNRLSCPCYQHRRLANECRVSPPGEFERPKKSGQGFDAHVARQMSPPANATESAGLSQAMAEFVERERRAWRTLPGCAEPPEDPYSDAHLAQLLGAMPRARLRRWDEVLAAWRAVCMTGHVVLVSLYKGRVAAAICDNPEARRAALGALMHYRVFKYVLAVALAGLASDGRRPPDALFLLDLSDRADVRTPGAP